MILDQYAPSSETLARWEQDKVRLIEFGDEPEFTSRKTTDKDQSIRNQLEAACAGLPFPKCRAYIKANRSAILHALPSNPRYWELFWEVAEIPELVDLSFDPSGQTGGYQRLIDAAYWWFYIDLAATGLVDIDHAIAIQQASRNWSTGYQTLTSRMIGLAIQGIVRNQLSFALAQANRTRDRDHLNRLAHVLQPTNASELGWGPVMWTELEYGLRSMREHQAKHPTSELDTESALIDSFGMIEPSVLRLMIEQPDEYYKSQTNLIAEHYLPVSTMPWDRYWQQGVPTFDERKLGDFSPAAVFAPSYLTYIVTERTSHFLMQAFPALIEIYAGRASPGVPALPPPANWHWEWVDGEQPKLCLGGVNLHPSTSLVSGGSSEDFCIEYYDEAAASSLIPR